MLSCMPFCGGKAVNKKRTPDSVWHKRLGRHWILENAAKIFVTTIIAATRVYRYTVELFNRWIPIPQSARKKRWIRLIHRRRSGGFWYYLEKRICGRLQKETDVPCAPIYTYDYRGLLFRVLYRTAASIWCFMRWTETVARFFRAIRGLLQRTNTGGRPGRPLPPMII